jgi:hypothetical protein
MFKCHSLDATIMLRVGGGYMWCALRDLGCVVGWHCPCYVTLFGVPTGASTHSAPAACQEGPDAATGPGPDTATLLSRKGGSAVIDAPSTPEHMQQAGCFRWNHWVCCLQVDSLSKDPATAVTAAIRMAQEQVRQHV